MSVLDYFCTPRGGRKKFTHLHHDSTVVLHVLFGFCLLVEVVFFVLVFFCIFKERCYVMAIDTGKRNEF